MSSSSSAEAGEASAADVAQQEAMQALKQVVSDVTVSVNRVLPAVVTVFDFIKGQILRAAAEGLHSVTFHWEEGIWHADALNRKLVGNLLMEQQIPLTFGDDGSWTCRWPRSLGGETDDDSYDSV